MTGEKREPGIQTPLHKCTIRFARATSPSSGSWLGAAKSARATLLKRNWNSDEWFPSKSKSGASLCLSLSSLARSLSLLRSISFGLKGKEAWSKV